VLNYIQGISLAVDLGGTNLRVCSVDLRGAAQCVAKHVKKLIPPEVMTASRGSVLFGLIAREVNDFLHAHHGDLLNEVRERGQIFPLGFTFSFPAYQNNINSGILLRWTKGFDIPEVVNNDVCKLLQTAIDELGLPVKVTALVNDALGALMYRAYTLPLTETRTSVGAIFGTGTNGVYLERLSEITKPLGPHDESTGEMFVSSEWGSFDNRLLVQPNTKYDVEVDQGSLNPGNQMFEKRLSGMFQGELLRVALHSLYTDPDGDFLQNVMWKASGEGNQGQPLSTKWAIDTSLLSIAATDNIETPIFLTQALSKTLGIPINQLRIDDVRAVKIIADAIGKRAARLAGMAIGSVLVKGNRLDDDDANTLPAAKSSNDSFSPALVDIAVDGSVVELYPGFEGYMRETWRVMNGIGPAKERRIKVGVAKEGSSIGAAVIALIVAKERKSSQNGTSST
jgi:hexokinase